MLERTEGSGAHRKNPYEDALASSEQEVSGTSSKAESLVQSLNSCRILATLVRLQH